MRLVSFVVLTEFHADKGSIVTATFPPLKLKNKTLLANLMLPSGSHRHSNDWTVFSLNSATIKISEIPSESGFKEDFICKEIFPATHYQLKDSLDLKNQSSVNVRISLSEKFEIVIRERDTKNNWGIKKSVNIQKKTNVRYKNKKAIFGDLGFELDFDHDSDFLKFQTLLKYHKSTKQEPKRFNSINKFHFINSLKENRNANFKRGVKYFALAIASPFRHCICLKEILNKCMNSFLTSLDLDELKKLYNCALFYDIKDYIERPFHFTKNSFFCNYNGKLIKTKLDKGNCFRFKKISILFLKRRFCSRNFGKIMTSMLLEQRIVFLGQKSKVAEICRTALSCTLLAGPLRIDVLERCFPYTDIFCLDFLDLKSYVVGVNNPIFLQKPEWWDLLVNVDEGSIIVSKQLGDILYTRKAKKFQKKLLNRLDALMISDDNVKFENFYNARIKELYLDVYKRLREDELASNNIIHNSLRNTELLGERLKRFEQIALLIFPSYGTKDFHIKKALLNVLLQDDIERSLDLLVQERNRIVMERIILYIIEGSVSSSLFSYLFCEVSVKEKVFKILKLIQKTINGGKVFDYANSFQMEAFNCFDETE